MSKKTLRKAYQKELAMALRNKRGAEKRSQEEDFVFDKRDYSQKNNY